MKKVTYLSIILVFLFGVINYGQPNVFNDEGYNSDSEIIEIEKEMVGDPIEDELNIDFLRPGERGIIIQKGYPRNRLFDKLNLTDEQKKQFEDLRNEHQKKMIDLRAQIQKNNIDIRNMMRQNKIDEKKLLDLVQTNNKLYSEMRTSRINHWLAVYKILNDEQKQILANYCGFGDGFGKRVFIKNKIFQGQRMKGCR